MKREDWRLAYEPLPDALESRVRLTLAHLEEEKPARRLSLRTAVIVLALLLALGGVAYAIFESRTAELFGWFYGGNWKRELEQGDFAAMGQSRQLGDVIYTIEELVYKTQGRHPGLYGVVRIASAPNSNIVLIPDDLSVDDPAGYLLHYGDVGQTISDEAPSYGELARQRGARLLMARAAVEGIRVNGEDCLGSYGESWLPQEDGTLLGTIDISDDLPRADSYELNLRLSNWEVTPEGLWLREEPNSTWLKENWILTVTPEKKGE